MSEESERDMEFRQIIYEKNEGIATITLNRPEALNALSKEVVEEINFSRNRYPRSSTRDNSIEHIISKHHRDGLSNQTP